MTFISILETIGKGFEKGLKWAVTYAVPVERLVALLFPAAAPVATELADRHHAHPERRPAHRAEVRRQRRPERHRPAKAR